MLNYFKFNKKIKRSKMLKKIKDAIILLVCLIGIFQLYLYTMVPAFKSNDSPETITASYTLGFGHPPSYPLFTMSGKVFSLLPVGSPAFRLNSFSIFLALMVLLLSYFIIKQISFYVFGYENKIINFFGVFMLAFSYTFWNQAIEAKGGIYIFNLFFLAILIYLSLELFKGFNIRYFYLMPFVYGLSLANHWPSMIILSPVFGYLFFRYRGKINQKNIMTISLLLLTGLSPYLYMLARGGTDGIFIFTARPNTWDNFWWTVLRVGYGNIEPPPTLQLYENQIKEFFALLFNNYYILWILMFAGGYIMNKRNKKLFWFYLGAILIIIFAVIIYNRTDESLMWVIDIFLIPSQYILMLFIVTGIYLILKLLKQKIFRFLFIFIIFITILFMGYKNFEKNNSRYDFQAYDFGYNILKTMDKDSLYLCEGDFNYMPCSYIQMVEKQRQDIKLVTVDPLPFKWGMDNFTKKYGNIPLKEFEPVYNLISIIKYFSDNNIEIFKSTIAPHMDGLKLELNFKQKGLLKKYLKNDKPMSPEIFELYSYNRGLYDKYIDYSRITSELVMWYPYGMMSQADDFLFEKEPAQAIQLYKKALLFPFKNEVKNSESHIYYNMSFAYKYLNDTDDQIKYLKKTIEIQRDYNQAYELLGMIYYNEKLWPMAKDMFENAIKYGSENKMVLQQYINQMGYIDMPTQLESLFNQAIALLAAGKYLKAMDYFDFLLEYSYKANEIYKNIGVYNFKNNNFEEALKYFQEAREWDKTVGIYGYIAYTYYKLGQTDKALDTLKEGIQTDGNDPQLVNLYNQIEQAGKKEK